MPLNDELSSVTGWMSIACWIIVYTPQIYENYKLKSGEGLSVPFVVLWLLGDLCNLVGAIMAGLIPTVIILAFYHTLCSLILLIQVYYYRGDHPTHIKRNEPTPDEAAPLLEHHRPEKSQSATTTLKKSVTYGLAVCFVLGTGGLAWYLNRSTDKDDVPGKVEVVVEWKSQVIGWCSAVLYLYAPIPQILKNRHTKCEGLSLALFVFEFAGNATYVLSICIKSMSWRHLIANSSWLAGSGLTIFLDFIILGQFFYYRNDRSAIAEDPVIEPDSGEL